MKWSDLRNVLGDLIGYETGIFKFEVRDEETGRLLISEAIPGTGDKRGIERLLDRIKDVVDRFYGEGITNLEVKIDGVRGTIVGSIILRDREPYFYTERYERRKWVAYSSYAGLRELVSIFGD